MTDIAQRGHPGPAVFGPLLRHHRLAVGLTQEALAERAGLAVRGIQDLERGIHLPQRATTQRLIRRLPWSATRGASSSGCPERCPGAIGLWLQSDWSPFTNRTLARGLAVIFQSLSPVSSGARLT